MNRHLLKPLLALALAGCATAQAGSAPYLKADLDSGMRGLRVGLNEPAYVAVFAIIPGEGATLVYPAEEGDPARLEAGRRTLPSTGAAYHRWQLSPAGRSRASMMYLVASRQPLNLAPFRGETESRGNVLRVAFAPHEASRVMEAVAAAVLPNGGELPEADWATAMLLRGPAQSGGQMAGGRGSAIEYRACPGGNTAVWAEGHICPRPPRPVQPPRPEPDAPSPTPSRGRSGSN